MSHHKTKFHTHLYSLFLHPWWCDVDLLSTRCKTHSMVNSHIKDIRVVFGVLMRQWSIIDFHSQHITEQLWTQFKHQALFRVHWKHTGLQTHQGCFSELCVKIYKVLYFYAFAFKTFCWKKKKKRKIRLEMYRIAAFNRNKQWSHCYSTVDWEA